MFRTAHLAKPMPALLQRIVNAESPHGDGAAQPLDMGQLPHHVSHAIWRGTEVGQPGQTVVSSGFSGLDAELPGGGTGLAVAHWIYRRIAEEALGARKSPPRRTRHVPARPIAPSRLRYWLEVDVPRPGTNASVPW